MKTERDYQNENDFSNDGSQGQYENLQAGEQDYNEQPAPIEKKRKGKKGNANKPAGRQQQNEQATEEENGYEEEVGGEEEEGGEENSKIEKIARQVMAYIKDNTENVNKAELTKYASIAVLAIFGMRKSSFLGSILISGAVAVLAKHLLTEATEKQA